MAANHDNNPIVAFVNDVTVTADLSQQPSSTDGWIKVLSDDQRLLRVLQNLILPGVQNIETIESTISHIELRCEQKPRAIRTTDSNRSPITLVAEIADDSTGVAECISPPLTHNVDHWLKLVIGTAANFEASVPVEGATHLRYDAPQFASLEIFQRLVWAFGGSHRHIRELFNTNSECRRLGPLPNELVELVGRPIYDRMTWPKIKSTCQSIGTITKFANVNLSNLIRSSPILNPVEFRMLPACVRPDEISSMIQLTDELSTGSKTTRKRR